MVIWVIKIFLYNSSVHCWHLFLISSASFRSTSFLSSLCPSAWNVPLVSLIFLKKSLVLPILLLFSISLHCHLRKAFFSLLAILWISAFRCVYLSFSSLPFSSVLSSSIFKASSDNHFFFFFAFHFLGMDLNTASFTMLWTSVHNSWGTLLYLVPRIYLSLPLYNHKIFDLGYLIGLVVFPIFFTLSLNFALRSSGSEPQSAPGLAFADCIEHLHLRLQRI